MLGKREVGLRGTEGDTEAEGWGGVGVWGLQILSGSIVIIATHLPRGWTALGPGVVLISSSCLLH